MSRLTSGWYSVNVYDLSWSLSFHYFVTPMKPPAGAVFTWEKYGAFLNSFHPKIKRLIRKLELINDKIG